MALSYEKIWYRKILQYMSAVSLLLLNIWIFNAAFFEMSYHTLALKQPAETQDSFWMVGTVSSEFLSFRRPFQLKTRLMSEKNAILKILSYLQFPFSRVSKRKSIAFLFEFCRSVWKK